MTQQTFDSKKLVIASMESEDLGRKTLGKPWRVLEFYSGIGGMRYSLMKAAVNAVVVEAFDINDLANDVYEHNFGHRPCQGNIQTLSPADLDSYKADAWLLSPPCQPYTRQGLQKGSADARASSFLKILELVPQTLRPPRMLFVENVVGFEASDTHQRMVSMLQENDFVLQEFILSPLHFGVPYSRPRYFCLAKSKLLSFHNPNFNNKLVRGPGPLCGNDNIVSCEPEEDSGRLLQDCQPVADFLEFNDSVDKTHPDSNPGAAKIVQLSEKADDEIKDFHHSSLTQYFVPSSLVERWGNAMDIVFPDSKRCCCFTKSYYRFVKGTGSLLATEQYEEGMQKNDVLSLEELHLRYFTPREVANLHSFPSDFQFPHHVSLRQRYALLGNSLSIAVVAPLLTYLFTTSPLPCNQNP